MKKLFTLAVAVLASVCLWAQTTASWTFEENATGIAIADAGSASTICKPITRHGIWHKR